MKLPQMTRSVGAALTLVSVLVVITPELAVGAETLDEITAVGEQRIRDGVAAQAAIEQLSERTDDLESEYKQNRKLVEGLAIYNDLLGKQVDNQLAEIETLSESIAKVSLIERQIVPLMVQMIETLAEFVELDTPFLPDERERRVQNLRTMMERSDVSSAEKFRRIIEAYQVENEYGRTIEAYRGAIETPSGKRELNFLRVGRIALLYQSDDGQRTAVWDRNTRAWLPLAREVYEREVALGLRVARKQVAPDLLVLPIAAAAGISR